MIVPKNGMPAVNSMAFLSSLTDWAMDVSRHCTHSTVTWLRSDVPVARSKQNIEPSRMCGESQDSCSLISCCSCCIFQQPPPPLSRHSRAITRRCTTPNISSSCVFFILNSQLLVNSCLNYAYAAPLLAHDDVIISADSKQYQSSQLATHT